VLSPRGLHCAATYKPTTNQCAPLDSREPHEYDVRVQIKQCFGASDVVMPPRHRTCAVLPGEGTAAHRRNAYRKAAVSNQNEPILCLDQLCFQAVQVPMRVCVRERVCVCVRVCMLCIRVCVCVCVCVYICECCPPPPSLATIQHGTLPDFHTAQTVALLCGSALQCVTWHIACLPFHNVSSFLHQCRCRSYFAARKLAHSRTYI